jgi:dTDP-4-amino-4,6-dideoxygalactose transaminase
LSANLYGIPNRLPEIEAFARDSEIDFIDDAAQAMGATVDGRHVGTFGSAGLFSLDKGKNITSIQGGILITSQPSLADALTRLAKELPPPSPLATMLDAAKLFAYAAILPPRVYWLTRYLPFLNLGKTPYTTEYTIRRYSSYLAPVAHRMFQRLEVLNTTRRHNADALRSALDGIRGLRLPYIHDGVSPAYTRFPVFISDPNRREEALRLLNRRGIVATVSYPQAIPDISELSPFLTEDLADTPGARQIANEILTVPTHPFVTDTHIMLIRDTLRDVLMR